MGIGRIFSKKEQSVRLVGSKLDVDLPQLGVTAVAAKVDTGAYSGALHATGICEIKRGRRTHLRFAPLGDTERLIEVSHYHRRKVKSSNGAEEQRYAIDTDVVLLGQLYPITLTLTDRGSMKHPLLIGRNFLRTYGFIVDVSQPDPEARRS